MPTLEEIQAWRGRNLLDRDGDKIGSIEDIYLDQETEQPEWIAVKSGLLGNKVSFVPTAEAKVEGDDVRVPYEKSLVKDSPDAEADGELSQDEEARIYGHYGLEYTEHQSGSGLADQGSPELAGTSATGDDNRVDAPSAGDDRGDVSGPDTDQAMTRSEEQIEVGTRRRESGRVRLRKYVVTENVTRTVPVEREEVRVEREPITDANRDEALAGGDITEEEHEVTLHTEEPVVEKQVVPQERVRLDKDTVTEEEQVSDEVRQERIETEGDVAERDVR